MNAETALVLRARKGDRQAFSLLAEGCRPWLFGLCFRLVRDRSTAEDLVQESLLRAFRGLPQLRNPEHFRPWLSRIAVNACRMHLRRLLARPEELPHPAPARVGESEAQAPLRVDEALAAMTAGTRRLLLLFYGEGLTHAELGDVLALSPAAVKSRLHRARERLRREMIATMSENQKARLGVGEEAPWALRTILLVEPNATIREPLRKALTAAGYEVETLPTGEAALAAVGQRRGQLLILDKHCGEPNWVEVLTLIQVDAWSRENVPVGVLVDPDNQRDRLLAWQAGATFCLTRPPQAREVVDLVARVARLWPDELGVGPPTRQPRPANHSTEADPIS